MIYIPIVALVVGILVGFLLRVPLHPIVYLYVAVASVAGLDSVCGGLRSAIEGKFRTDVFLTGFVSNVLIAFFLCWLGDRIGLNIRLATILVMGTRIFTNLSIIRRQMLTKWHDVRERKRSEAEAKSQQNEAEASPQPTVAT